MAFIKTKIITIKSLIFEISASEVIIPALDGEIGVLPGHIPMLVELGSGKMQIRANNIDYKYFVYGGIAEITGEAVNILSDFAVNLITISKAQILEEIQSLEERLKQEMHDHNIAAIKSNLHKQQELLQFL